MENRPVQPRAQGLARTRGAGTSARPLPPRPGYEASAAPAFRPASYTRSSARFSSHTDRV